MIPGLALVAGFLMVLIFIRKPAPRSASKSCCGRYEYRKKSPGTIGGGAFARALARGNLAASPSSYSTISFKPFSGVTLTTVRAGFALKIVSSPVKGLIPISRISLMTLECWNDDALIAGLSETHLQHRHLVRGHGTRAPVQVVFVAAPDRSIRLSLTSEPASLSKVAICIVS